VEPAWPFREKGEKGILILASIVRRKAEIERDREEPPASVAGFRVAYGFAGLSRDLRELGFTKSVGKYRAEEGFFDG
jgi:hypothetical protein